MAITYTVLTGLKTVEGSLKNWANNSLIPATTILTLAEAELAKRLRIREMQARTTGTMSTSDRFISLPTGYRQHRALWITGIDKTQIWTRTPENVEAEIPYDGDGNIDSNLPRFCWDDGSQLNLDLLPDKAYPYALIYYKALTVLSSSNETNVLTDNYPGLLITACQYIAYGQYLRNAKERDYHQKYMEQLVREANADSDMNTMHDLDLPIYAG